MLPILIRGLSFLPIDIRFGIWPALPIQMWVEVTWDILDLKFQNYCMIQPYFHLFSATKSVMFQIGTGSSSQILKRRQCRTKLCLIYNETDILMDGEINLSATDWGFLLDNNFA